MVQVKMNKVIVCVILSIFLIVGVNAISLGTTPTDSSTTTITSSTYTIIAEVQNDNIGLNLTGVTINISISPASSGLTVDGVSTIIIGDMSDILAGDGTWTNTTQFDLDFNLNTDTNFTATITVDSTEGQTQTSTFDLNYDSITEPNIVASGDDVSTIALQDLYLPINITNDGTGNRLIPFDIILEYNNTFFTSKDCDLGCNAVVDLGNGYSQVSYTMSNLNQDTSQIINFTFNTTSDLGYIHTKDFKVTALSSIVYPQVTINPVPIYQANVTQIYNDSSSPINILTNSINVAIPINIRNIGNGVISNLDFIALINGSNLASSSTTNLGVGSYYSPSPTYKFSQSGLYNISISINGSNSVTDSDFKLLNITFNFTDNDSDGYFPIANGGKDCNDNNAAIRPGVIDICGNGIDEDCSSADRNCGGSGGSRRDDDDDDEEINETPEIEVLDKITFDNTKPTKQVFKLNKKVEFSLKNKELHHIVLKEIGNNYIVLTIESDPIEVKLNVSETKTIDINNDTIDDLEITLDEIINSTYAQISIQDISIEEIEEVVVDLNETPTNTTNVFDLFNLTKQNETKSNLSSTVDKAKPIIIKGLKITGWFLLWLVLAFVIFVFSFREVRKYQIRQRKKKKLQKLKEAQKKVEKSQKKQTKTKKNKKK